MIFRRFAAWLKKYTQRFLSKNVSLIEDADLMKLIASIGKQEEFENGKLQCSYCGKQLSKDNLGGFVVLGGVYKFVCDDKTCITRIEN